MAIAIGPARRWRVLRNVRRVSQIVFLGLFVGLVLLSVAATGSAAGVTGRMPYPVEVFLLVDPFVAALTLLGALALPAGLLLSLIVLGSAVFLGRGFCSFVCPLGALNHGASELGSSLTAKQRRDHNRYRSWQRVKYLVLVASLVAALFGSAVGGLLDPICLATRGLAQVLLPWVQWILGASLGSAVSSNVPLLQHGADGVYALTSGSLLADRSILVGGGATLALLFVAVIVANRFWPRLWCRLLCPLGALLGAAGRFGMLGLRKDETRCDHCGRCELSCQGAASPEPGQPWKRSECDLCLNCVAACPHQALAFGLAGHRNDVAVDGPNLGRRRLLVGAATGAVLVPALRTGGLGPAGGGRPDPSCIRPPGALDERAFLERCVRCGQCQKVCPNRALHPALVEAGLEGLWTPVLVARIGYCEPTCTLCTQVCPTGALRRVSDDEKLGRNGKEMVRLGTAFIDRGRCLPWAMGVPCMVCEEFCPTSPKAIWTKEVEVDVRGTLVKLRQPAVDPAQCNGCGACEFICPVHDRAAIRVSAAGESRAPGHALLLARDKKS